MAARSYTIGQISRLTRLSVRRLRFYADKGLLPPSHRSDSGYRLFGDEDIVRIDLIRALREAGLGLEAIRDVLAQKLSLKQVLALRLEEVEAHLTAQRRVASALRAALASAEPSNDDLRRIWIMTNLSQSERSMAVERFFEQVTQDSELDPRWSQWMVRMSTPRLHDEPSGEQLDAWLELSGLMADPVFITQMRDNGLDSSGPMNFELFSAVQKQVVEQARAALAAGFDPASPQGEAVASAYLDGWAEAMGVTPDAAFYARMARKHLQHRPLMARYWDLVTALGAQPERSEPTPEWQWIEAAAVARLKALPN